MKDLLKWGLIAGGGWLLLRNVGGSSSEPEPDPNGATSVNDSGAAQQPNGSVSQGSSSNGGAGSNSAQQQPAAVRRDFWGWNYVLGNTSGVPESQWPDPFTLPRFAGKTVAQVQADLLTLPEYQAAGGLAGLGCGGGCGCGCSGEQRYVRV